MLQIELRLQLRNLADNTTNVVIRSMRAGSIIVDVAVSAEDEASLDIMQTKLDEYTTTCTTSESCYNLNTTSRCEVSTGVLKETNEFC